MKEKKRKFYQQDKFAKMSFNDRNKKRLTEVNTTM